MEIDKVGAGRRRSRQHGLVHFDCGRENPAGSKATSPGWWRSQIPWDRS